MQNIILTGVDGSETAAKAAEVAASLAVDLKCELYVISATDPDQVRPPRLGQVLREPSGGDEIGRYQRALDTHVRAAQETADQVATKLGSMFPNLSITAKGINKTPVDAIIDEAEYLEARFVVVGNKHVQGASRILGSVAASVARHIKTDLYIAHTR